MSAHRADALRVCVDARLEDGVAGGMQQAILGLAAGLSTLDDGDETYLFLVRDGTDGWLRPWLRGPCRALSAPGPTAAAPGVRARVRRVLGPAVSTWVARGPLGRFLPVAVPRSDGTIERAGVDVMHFTLHAGFLTDVPSLFVPHDLQHLHHPEHFTPLDRRWRACFYPALARQARLVVALSRHGQRDVVERLGTAPTRVRVVGWAPPIDAYAEPSPADLLAVRSRHALPEAFALYPAQTWPHKNHLRLLEALAILRDRHGLRVHAVFTGRQNEFFPVIERRVRRLGLRDQVRFTGYVPPLELAALYRLARLLAFPSTFEGFGLPIVEAFRAGLPVACARTTSIPELAGDAALLFDPERPDDVAAALARLWSDGRLRAELADRGRRRVAAMSWRDVALRYRALYRLVAGRGLDDADRARVDATA